MEFRTILEGMETQKEQIAPEIMQAIIAQATASGLTVNDYLSRLLGLTNGHVEDLSLPSDDSIDDLLGVFDSSTPFERPQRELDAFGGGVISKLEKQGLKLP